MKRLFFVLTINFLLIVEIAAQEWISGTIIDPNSNPIKNVVIKCGSDSTVSDLEGKYKLQARLGRNFVEIKAPKFQPFTDTIEIKSNEIYSLKVQLQFITEDNVVIRKTKIKPPTTSEFITAQIFKQTALGNGISIEDMKKVPTSTTEDVVKRVSGATIMEGKFANVRGMFERYNAGYLNSASLPSTETDRKAFSFNIIPSSLIDNLFIVKSGTPDLMADFGGGIIQINTKSIPIKKFAQVSFGLQYNSITTFNTGQTIDNPTLNFTGMLPNSSALPELNGILNQSAAVNARESKKFNHNWNVSNTQFIPGPRLSLTYGQPFLLNKKKNREFGYILSYNYALTQRFNNSSVESRDLGDNRITRALDDKIVNNNVQNGGIANFSYRHNNNHILEWKNLINTTLDENHFFRKGISDVDNGYRTQAFSKLINQNRLFNSQLIGKHSFAHNKLEFNWVANFGNNRKSQPDYRIAQYTTFDDGTRQLAFNDFFNAGTGRFFSNLNENNYTLQADAKVKFSEKNKGQFFKWGAMYTQRFRQFNSREFVYGPVAKTIISERNPAQDLNEDQIGENNIYLTEKTAYDRAEYTGNSRTIAGYAMFELNIPVNKTSLSERESNIRLTTGVRYENFFQVLDNDYMNRLKLDLANSGVLINLLPSFNLLFNVNKTINIRGSYFMSVNRPEMREIAPFAFYNFSLNAEFKGNSKLKTATIHNSDFKIEYKGEKAGYFSAGLFYKKIVNPIELSLDVTQAAIRTFTYSNSSSADIQGLEFEARYNFEKAAVSSHLRFIKGFEIFGNLTLVKSVVQIQAGNDKFSRQLQGQSPYVVNLNVSYNFKNSGTSFNLALNKLGDRIAFIGVPKVVQPFGMDIYEYGRTTLDFQIAQKIKRIHTFKITVGDILAQNSVFYQDINGNKKYDSRDNKINLMNNGRTVTLNYTMEF